MPIPPAFRLPAQGTVPPVSPKTEPTRYYYWPVVGRFYSKRLQIIFDQLSGRRYARLLEVASGSGIFLPSLATMCDSLHGADWHRHGALVRRNLNALGIVPNLVSADALALPYSNSTFDAVVNVSMLEHLHTPGLAIAEMHRVLVPGGVLALGFPCRNPWMDAFFRLLGYNPREIHPSSHQNILDAVAHLGLVAQVHVFPSMVPLNFALYCVCIIRASGSLTDCERNE